MIKWIEGIAYYLSCMVFFHLIYIMSILADMDKSKLVCNIRDAKFITIILAVICMVLGIIFTWRILNVDDSEINSVSLGKQFQVLTVNDLTAENYFANFSLIVLTGLSLPTDPSWYHFIIFVLIEISIGIVYIKKRMYYMNPILTLLNYSVYECTGFDRINKKMFDGKYYFITNKLEIKENDIIEYNNIKCRIIRLNKK